MGIPLLSFNPNNPFRANKRRAPEDPYRGLLGRVLTRPLAACFGIGPVVGSVPPVSLSDISKLRSITCTCEGTYGLGTLHATRWPTGGRNDLGMREARGAGGKMDGWAATCWVSRRSTGRRSRSLAARART